MKISASQSQLLRQLNIRPLQHRPGLFPDADSHSSSQVVVTSELLEPEHTSLTADIKLVLAQTVIDSWLLDTAATQCVLVNNNCLLITPVLASLQQPALKQQLWALLQHQLTDNVD